MAVVSWLFAGLVLAILALLRWQADLSGPGQLLMVLPRWGLLGPLGVLAILSARSARRLRLWALQASTALVIAGPIMGISLPTGRLLSADPPGPRVRIMTLNTFLGRSDFAALAREATRERIDVLCLQEMSDPGGSEPFLAWGWHRDSSRTILSRLPIIAEWTPGRADFPEYGFWRAQFHQVLIELPTGEKVAIANIHMPSVHKTYDLLRQGDSAAARRYARWRWEQAGALAALVKPVQGVPAVVAGDFNMPADGAMTDLFRDEFRFGFEEAGWGYGYTWPSPAPWVGIDHVLASPGAVFTECRVGPDLGSDHRPVIAEVALTPPPTDPR